mgnify:CR=1 FL=1
MVEWAKVWGVNGGVLAAVSLSEVELLLKVVALVLTIIWTIIKIVKLLGKDD